MTDFTDRHLIELAARPEIRQSVDELTKITFAGNLPKTLHAEIFTVASVGAGCRHCQVHGAYSLSQMGTDADRIRDLWSFQTSDQFTDAERAALEFALAAGKAPSEVTPEHHAELRKYYTDAQVGDVLAVICLAGWLNRWNDSLATVTDQESVDWGNENLTQVGWAAGKHTGEKAEQRTAHPNTMREQGKGVVDR